ncbi:uncharacterized protein LOC135475398 [Liolophura sinensis]|uniref:uncharacterized protein LOC135475398 n=1 Tax=Liolophura sinensis TaxID=3198878 RepID=UPI003159927C
MQAINITAYKRLGDSYAEENGGLLEEAEIEVMGNGRRGKPKKDGYEKLNGNSDSEDGYETAVDTDGDVDRTYLDKPDVGYQRSCCEKDMLAARERNVQTGANGGYQSLASSVDYTSQGYQGYQTQERTTKKSRTHGNDEQADDCGYFKLEGFSEFCGNLTNMKNTDIRNGYSVQVGNVLDENKKLCEEQPAMDSEDVKIEATPQVCGFRCIVKLCQMTFCVLALTSALFTNSWLSTAVGVWFMVVNFLCGGIAGSVLLAQIYRKIDRLAICRRKLIQVTYFVMIPMLLSAGLSAASVATSRYYRTEFEKSMMMVASMFCLMALFATITDVVMNRRTWRMFRLAGGNAYIHAAFMA